jgi:putative two-component system response regulator
VKAVLHVKDGVIERASGDTEELLGFTPQALAGLPYALFQTEPERTGFFTAPLYRRDGTTALVHLYIQPAEGGLCVHIENVFGDQVERMRLSFQRVLFQGLALAAEDGDPDLLAHLSRVTRYTAWLAQGALGWSEIDTARLVVAALVHDVGKSSIPREILFKPTTLTPEERLLVETHMAKGRSILEKVERDVLEHTPWLWDAHVFQMAKDIALYHHENWDGSGKPEGRAGEAIPLWARVVKIADVTDALLHARPYKSAWTKDSVREEFVRLAGTEYDPDLARWWVAHAEEMPNPSGEGGDLTWWPF